MSGADQTQLVRYPDSPACIVCFGHHKCASRFFRTRVFTRIAELTAARLHKYEIADPPFHFSAMDELDLSNIDFSRIGEGERDVVLFGNATRRSLDRIDRATASWKGVRILRDPRQVLVSSYFHHRGDHGTETLGWVWDQLVQDKPILRALPEEQGLLYELDNISKQVIECQLLEPFDDKRVLTVKLEDFERDPGASLAHIASFLAVPGVAAIELERTGANPDSGPWRNHFTDRLRRVFKERYGEALIELGYAEDLDW